MSSAASRIVIIGAGIGGLTLALLLRRRGVIAEIIHRDGRDGTRIAAHALGRQYREAFGAPCSACTGSRCSS
jgi:2-polyprenyl-6-methoxyphenol hydroxylase-like FAD-dependent oxidoreductase